MLLLRSAEQVTESTNRSAGSCKPVVARTISSIDGSKPSSLVLLVVLSASMMLVRLLLQAGQSQEVSLSNSVTRIAAFSAGSVHPGTRVFHRVHTELRLGPSSAY